MLINNNLNKYYKFIIMFETYSTSLKTYLDNIQAKKSQMFKEDLVRLFKTFVTTLNYMYQS